MTDYTLRNRTITTLTALSERHEEGDRVDHIISATLATLICAVEEGRTDELWAQLSPIWTKWGAEISERIRAMPQDDADRENVISDLRPLVTGDAASERGGE